MATDQSFEINTEGRAKALPLLECDFFAQRT